MKYYRLYILVIFTIFLYRCTSHTPIMVIGHRGAMGHDTENTLAAVQKAIALGADIIEIDVFTCKSGELVVFHDHHVERLTNGSGPIEDLSFFQLKQLTLKGGHQIPLLQDVLKCIDRRCILNIELKGTGIAPKVNHILEYYIKTKGWKPKDFIVSSFDLQELRDFYAINKSIPIGILTHKNPVTVIKTAQELQAFAINASYKTLTKEQVHAVKKQGFKLYAGVVNDHTAIQYIKTLGVDGICTDFPERIR